MATAQQLPKLVSVLVEHQQGFSSLSTEDAQWAIKNPADVIALACDAITKRTKSAVTALLAFVGSIVLPATEKFVAEKNFTRGAGNIGWLGDNFKNWFLGKVEEPAAEAELRYLTLTRASVDTPIISELGGEEKCEVALAHVFALIERQKTGNPGELLTSGYANIFYVRDVNATLRAVSARWRAGRGYWGVGASPVGYPGVWGADYRVFSRK